MTEETKRKDVVDVYLHLVTSSIDTEGIFPWPCCMMDSKEKMHVISIADSNPENALLYVMGQMTKINPVEVIFGIDRYNKEGQGVDEKYKSVFVMYHMKNEKWRTGVFAYNSAEEHAPVDWDNKFWTNRMKLELTSIGMMNPSTTMEVVGNAYSNKINITTFRKNELGTFYEGFIVKENLDAKVQEFLNHNALDINDREAVQNTLAVPFEYSFEYGFWNLKVGKAIFPARKSRTKIYLEGVESLINGQG